MHRLAAVTDAIATHDRRDEDDGAVLHRQARALLAGGVVAPSGRTSAGRTAASLFDRESAARIALLLTLTDAGFTVPELRAIAPLLDGAAYRPRRPNTPHPSSGFAEAVAAIAAGETGWTLTVEVIRGPAGRRFGVQITAPDTPAASPGVAGIIGNLLAAQGENVVLRVVVDIAARIRPVLSLEG